MTVTESARAAETQNPLRALARFVVETETADLPEAVRTAAGRGTRPRPEPHPLRTRVASNSNTGHLWSDRRVCPHSGLGRRRDHPRAGHRRVTLVRYQGELRDATEARTGRRRGQPRCGGGTARLSRRAGKPRCLPRRT